MYSPPTSSSHNAYITTFTPAYFILLIDQSGSMSNPVPRKEHQPALAINRTKRHLSMAQTATNMINSFLDELILESTTCDRVRNWFEVSVIGYRTDMHGNAVVGSLFSGALQGQETATIPSIAANVLFEERVQQKFINPSTGDTELENTERPCWIRPIADGGTPFSVVLCEAYRLASAWIDSEDRKEKCFPPIVINVTDADFSEDDGNEYTPEDCAARLKDLATNDGNVLLFNFLFSANSKTPVLYPDSIEQLGNDIISNRLYHMSSELPSSLIWNASCGGTGINQGARCFARNASSMDQIPQWLKLGE